MLLNLFVKLTGWPLWTLIARPKIYYEDKATQSRKIKGRAIVISNHTAVWDFASLLFLFPFRVMHCVVAEVLYEKNPFLSFFLKAIGCIRVDRHSHDLSFIRSCCHILEKNGVVELFPEARLPLKSETELLPFKPSVTILALESGAPIIPVYTDGRYFTKDRNRIIIGKPIDARALYNDALDEAENITIITEHVRGIIHELGQQLP